MITQLMDDLCPCFGKQLRRFRDEADMSLERLAELTGYPTAMLDEVERGRRAVSTEWILVADMALRANGGLRVEVSDFLNVHAGMVTDIHNEHTNDRACPIRLPVSFIAVAA
jgi:transcriptional regulator with XRE-family HTH domain